MIQTENQAINAIIEQFPSMKSNFFDDAAKLSKVLREFEDGIRKHQFTLVRSHMCDECKAKLDLHIKEALDGE